MKMYLWLFSFFLTCLLIILKTSFVFTGGVYGSGWSCSWNERASHSINMWILLGDVSFVFQLHHILRSSCDHLYFNIQCLWRGNFFVFKTVAFYSLLFIRSRLIPPIEPRIKALLPRSSAASISFFLSVMSVMKNFLIIKFMNFCP